MARIGLHGVVQAAIETISAGGVEFQTLGRKAIPLLDMLFNRIENTLNGQIDSTNLADYVSGSVSVVTTAKINDSAVTAAKLAASSVTSSVVDATVSKITHGSYTGDGTTANRVVALPFTPAWILIARTDATFIEFVALQDSGVATFWYRDAAGVQAAGTVNFQGIVSNGVKLGTSATGTSNVNAVVYRYTAIG